MLAPRLALVNGRLAPDERIRLAPTDGRAALGDGPVVVRARARDLLAHLFARSAIPGAPELTY